LFTTERCPAALIEALGRQRASAARREIRPGSRAQMAGVFVRAPDPVPAGMMGNDIFLATICIAAAVAYFLR
jgi:hypothetical protein